MQPSPIPDHAARTRALLLAGALLASFGARAQSLVASQSAASTGQSSAPVTLAFTPGADSGAFDFDLRYTALATTSVAQVNSTIPNGVLACSNPATGQLRCTVLAVLGAVDLGAGNITVGFTTGATPGTMPITFQAAHFFAQTGAPEAGSTTAGSLVLTTPPTLTIANISTVEGNAGTKFATFTVNLAPVSASPVSFDIATDTGTATPGVDYVSKSLVGQTISAGQSSASFTVAINGDAVVEDDETFTVNLRNVTGAAVGNAQAIGRIVNDDSASLSIADASVSEGNSGQVTAQFKITLNAPMPTPVTFNIATASGTATAGSDFVARSQVTRVIDAGRTSAVFEVSVIGDTVAEPDEAFSVTLSNVSGATLTRGSATGTILNDDGAALTSIAQIQGTGPLSPLEGKTVSTQGVVTAITAQGFFLQSADTEQDSNPASAEGVAVASTDPAISVGDRRRVDGLVQEVQVGSNPDQLPLTRIAATGTALLERDHALPRPVLLDASNSGPNGPVTALERFEGMRVRIASLDVVGPSSGTIDQTSGAIHDTGKFFGVARGIARPFREPGASVFDREPGSGAGSAGRFDGNPERLAVDSAGQRGARIMSADVGDAVTGLVGVLGYAEGAYQFMPDPDAHLAVTAGAHPRAVPVPAPGEASIGTLSLRGGLVDARPSTASPPTTDADAARAAKSANAICAFARAPDILAVTGVKNLTALEELAQAVNAGDGNLLFPGSCSGNPGYKAYLLPTPDGAGGTTGYLVRHAALHDGVPRVEVVSVSLADASARFRNADGTTRPLNDNPPLILEAVIRGDGGRRLAITVIANALSALEPESAAPGSHGWRTRGDALRARRLAQATFLGRLVRDRQRTHPGENLVVLGNFEAPEFSDGHADLLGLISAGSRTRAARGQRSGEAPDRLSNLIARLPPGERYTVVREGNAQAMDHVLVNASLLAASPGARLAIARINADFGEDNADDAGVPMRISDHDPVVLLLAFPD